MKKEDIQYEVTELARLSKKLHEASRKEEIMAYLMNVYYNMCDLLTEPDYSEDAEAIIQCVEWHDAEQDAFKAKDEVLGKLESLIEKMNEDFQKPEESGKMESVLKEIKEVCVNVAGIISHEAKVAWDDAGKAIKAQEMPECAGAIAEVKGIPKRLERNLKKGIKKWLNEDK